MDESGMRINFLKNMHSVIKNKTTYLVPVEYLIYECDRLVYFKMVLDRYNSMDNLARQYVANKLLSDVDFLNGYKNSIFYYGNVHGVIPEYNDDTLIVKYLYSDLKYRKLPYDHHVRLASFYKYLVEHGKSETPNANIQNVYIIYLSLSDFGNPIIYKIDMDSLLPDQIIVDVFNNRAGRILKYYDKKIIPPAVAGWECSYCNYMEECLNV